MGIEVCSLFSEGEIEPLKKSREIYLKDVAQFKGFAETFSTFGRIAWLESSIPTIICASRVPSRETRKLVRCRSTHEASNVPAFQFMRELFNQIGFELGILDINTFNITLRIKPPIYESPTKQQKTCYTTAEAIYRFFSKDLGLECKVEEVKCVNEGAESCDFKCTLEFISLCKIALDRQDKDLVKLIARNMSLEELLREGYYKDADELKFRLDILREYGIIDEKHGLTEKGKEFRQLLAEEAEEEEDFDPPWKDIKEISSAISAAESFAEAAKETSNQKNGGSKNE